jgi:hypothetical protein
MLSFICRSGGPALGSIGLLLLLLAVLGLSPDVALAQGDPYAGYGCYFNCECQSGFGPCSIRTCELAFGLFQCRSCACMSGTFGNCYCW